MIVERFKMWYHARVLGLPDYESDDKGTREAHEAVVRSSQTLSRVQAQGQEVREVSASLRALRERNHFGEAVAAAMATRRKHA